MFKILNFASKTLTWWYDQRPNIDLSPPYQRRGGRWARSDRAFLVDSILNEYDIPKLYIADFSFTNTPLNVSQLQYAVIDGKQRFETIFGFFDNAFPLNDNFVFFDDPALRLGGLYYADLKANYPKLASRFENYNLSVMSVVTDDEAKINDLFIRLNRSKPLTGAELRNAMGGIVPRLIRSTASHEFFTSRINFRVLEGQDQNLAAKLLLLEFRGRFVDTKKADLDRLVNEGLLAEGGTQEIERSMVRAKGILANIVTIFVPRDPLLSTQGPVPVYYWMTRTIVPRQHGWLREFFLQFENERRTARTMLRNPAMAADVDPELALYEQLNRSTNDQRSLEGRYTILMKRYRDFLKARQVDGPIIVR